VGSVQWRPFVSTVLNLGLLKRQDVCCLAERLSPFQEGLCFIFEAEARVNNIQTFRPYRKQNKSPLAYKFNIVNVVQGNNRCLYWESYVDAHLWENCIVTECWIGWYIILTTGF
jgi:hypothetical protein